MEVFMKKIMYITTLCFLLLLSGCGGYTRDETPGALRTISVADMEKKMKNKEDFVIVFTQSWCAHWEKFRDMLDEYLPKHHVIVYDVVIDKDPNPDRSGNIKKIQSYFKTMDSTPSLYYVEKGKVKDELENGDDGITKEKFDSWVQNFKLDEKK